MAAQPPSGWGQPPQKPTDAEKSWYQRPMQVALISGVILLVLGAIFNAIFGGGGGGGGNEGPTSDGASISATLSDDTLTVEGSGWKGDSKVSVVYPFTPDDTRSDDELVSPDGTFTFTAFTRGLVLRPHTVRVKGEQTGYEVTEYLEFS